MPKNSKTDPEIVDLLAAEPSAVDNPTAEDSADESPVVEVPVFEPPTFELSPSRPVPESVLTPDQRRIRDLENQIALERGRKDPVVEFEPPAAQDDTNIIIHILEDGFTVLGQVWCRGQELEFTPGSHAWRDTHDRFGWSWLSLRNDEVEQDKRYGTVMFRNGPWPGKSYEDAAKQPFESLQPVRRDGPPVRPPTEEELHAATIAEQKRRRAAPRLPIR